MKIGWLFLSLLLAMLIPAQALMNAKMRTFVVNPMYSSIINFAVGAVLILTVTGAAIALGQGGNWRGASQAPWWAWCGGLIGASIVLLGILAVPNIGAANYSVAIIAGQLFGALVLDHFGWLGVQQHSISPPRLLGAGLLMVGVWLIQRN
jgi:bacterial/archaeal transporter family-2 protein